MVNIDYILILKNTLLKLMGLDQTKRQIVLITLSKYIGDDGINSNKLFFNLNTNKLQESPYLLLSDDTLSYLEVDRSKLQLSISAAYK